MAITPVTWRVVSARMRDGDSVYLVRERELSRDDLQVLTQRDPKPVLCRLTWLKCPEISGPHADPINGPRATNDAQFWLDLAGVDGLVAVQYGFEKYGRPLVDVRDHSVGSSSLSIYMTAVKGWDVYR